MSTQLDELVSAYRTQSKGDSDAAADTRRRLLHNVHRKHQGRRAMMALSVIGAIMLSNSITWAWFTGRLDGLTGAEPILAISPSAPPSPPQTTPAEVVDHRQAATLATMPSPSATLIESEEVLLPTVFTEESVEAQIPAATGREHTRRPGTARRPSPEHARRSARSANPPANRDDESERVEADVPAIESLSEEQRNGLLADLRALEPEPVHDAERQAFARAHQAHFSGDNPATALTRWNGYLARFPSGRFLPEARFNRAISLLRLGRNDDARRVLEAFANGSYGNAHEQDARQLLEAMSEGRLRSAP